MPLLDKIKGLFANGAGNFVEKVKEFADEFNLSKEEKEKFNIELTKMANDHTEKMATLALDEMKLELEREKAQLADTASARDSNTKIQESDKASWMAKNIAYCIDGFVILLWGVLTIYLIASALKIVKTNQVDLTGIYGLYAAVTGVAMTIINFHRGSSVGSERKQKFMEEVSKK